MSDINIGLDGIVVGETAISDVQGDKGELSYRGYLIEQLIHRSFSQVAWLLLFGEFPNDDQEQQLAQLLLRNNQLGEAEIELLKAVPQGTHPMLMLQGLIPLLDTSTPVAIELPDSGEDACQGLLIAARLPALIAAYYRREQGQLWPVTSSSTDPMRAFLHSFHGHDPGRDQAQVLSAVQIMQMEHSYNASTFAGRVVLSTQAPAAASISASIGALFGKLHGGADQAALETAMAIGKPEQVGRQVRELLAKGERIMGIGHREYRTLDPRAKLLKPLARQVCKDKDSKRLLDTLEAIESACIEELEKPGRTLRANVEFYKGAVFHALGIPPRYFTALFAMARVYGYLAHMLEFRPQARLIRPQAHYIGT